jgi:hypothetical protein
MVGPVRRTNGGCSRPGLGIYEIGEGNKGTGGRFFERFQTEGIRSENCTLKISTEIESAYFSDGVIARSYLTSEPH